MKLRNQLLLHGLSGILGLTLISAQDNVFISWGHSYADFHNRSNCWVCGAMPMSIMDGLPWWVSPLRRGDMPSLCDYFLQLKQQKSNVETVITAATTHWFDKKADDLTKGHGIHFNCILSSENAYQYYVIANKSKQLKKNRYFDQFYQI